MSKLTVAAAVCAVALLSGGAASAAIYDQPLAKNAYITVGRLDWAWASPNIIKIDFSYQGAFGWRYATSAELAKAPDAKAFQFAGANVPYNGVDPLSGSWFAGIDASLKGAAACATAYFSTTAKHCNWGNGPGTLLNPLPWVGEPGALRISERVVVRVSAVPIPASLGLLGLGLASIFGMRRRKA